MDRQKVEQDEQFYEALKVSLTNRTPSAEQIERIEQVKEYGKILGSVIAEYCPHSRGRSLAGTKLEECVMWAVKSIVLED